MATDATVGSPQSQMSPAKRRLLEKFLHGDQVDQRTFGESIQRRDPAQPVPLSYEQEQLWLHAQMAPKIPLYNEIVTFHHTGALDANALERAFNEILRRHEAWRTFFSVVDGQPVQIVCPTLSISLPEIDLRHLPDDQRNAEALRILSEDATQPFDLTQVPLFRARLIRLADQQHRLCLTLSHILFDGNALYRVFLPELVALYSAFAEGAPSPLPELPVQYADYACWQRQSVDPVKLTDDLAFWRRQFGAGFPTLNLPADHPRQGVPTFRGSTFRFEVGGPLAAELRSLSQREGVTLFHTLLACFAIVLRRYCGQESIPIGSVTSTRTLPETQPLLGYFLNTVVLLTDLSGDPTFRELLQRVRNVTLEAMDHSRIPFGQLINELRIQRDVSRNPLFQAMCVLEPPMPELDAAWTSSEMDVETGVSKYDLHFALDARSDRIIGRFHYSTELFEASTISRIAAQWQRLLAETAAAPGKRLSEFPVLSESERRQLLVEWNDTSRPCPQTTIHQLFEARAALSPEAIAVSCNGRQLSYRELNRRSNQLARYLRKLGVGPEVLVGLCVERSIDMVVGLLGILKAGGAYVPLDPAFPKDRLALVLADADPGVVVTQRSVQALLPTQAKQVLLDEDWWSIRRESGERLDALADAKNRAYVIYTSGSTGIPKGVQIEHRNAVNLLLSIQQQPGLTSQDILAAVSTISFDIATLEIFLPLISGARIEVVSSEIARDGTLLADLLKKVEATVMDATPATWRLLIEAGWQRQEGFRVFCTGEAMTPDLARELTSRSAEVWNLYGPTETTIWSSAYRLTGSTGRFVPIGRPLANTQIYVLDAQLNPVPVGVTGEVYIAGDGVARGYLNRPQLTDERFLPNPFREEAGARMYKTGDVARYLADGTIEYLGRSDQQVKLRGWRIELGDIEATIAQHPAVGSAVTLLREDVPGDPRLAAYVIRREGKRLGSDELRQFLKQKLPEYMVPTHIAFLDVWPLTPNGKLNRKALPAPDAVAESATHDLIEPRNELEMKLRNLWERVLNTRPIGVQDDFFGLGGHSLLALRLFLLIEKELGVKIPLSTLLGAPTIEQLAGIIRQDGKEGQWSPLVPIQPNGSLPPIYCVHGHFGEVLFYRPLSRRLGDDQPFFALQAQAREGLPAHTTIEAMASEYVAEIRKVQPKGPYRICGYCLGAIIAFEMAQQLCAAGEKVEFLGLFMGRSPDLPPLSKRIKLHLEQFKRIGSRAKLEDLKRNAAGKAKSLLWRMAYQVFQNDIHRAAGLLKNIPELNIVAAKKYIPKQYSGKMTVFMSGVPEVESPLDLKADLYGLRARNVELQFVPGYRDTMLQEPCVRVLSEQLQDSLKQAVLTAQEAPADQTKSTLRASIIITAYNSAAMIGRAISSALAAIRPDDEIIVVDDGSTDDTEHALLPFRHRIRYLHISHRGAGGARNYGIKNATHELVAFLDAEHEWLPGQLELQRSLMESRGDIVYAFGKCSTSQEDRRGQKRNKLESWHGKRPSWEKALGPAVPFSSMASLPPGFNDFKLYCGELSDCEMAGCYPSAITLVLRRRESPNSLSVADELPVFEDWLQNGKQACAAYLDYETAIQHGNARVPDTDAITRGSSAQKVLERVWGADCSFMRRHSQLYWQTVAQWRLRMIKRLIVQGRTKEARQEANRPPQMNLGWPYILLLELPGQIAGSAARAVARARQLVSQFGRLARP